MIKKEDLVMQDNISRKSFVNRINDKLNNNYELEEYSKEFFLNNIVKPSKYTYITSYTSIDSNSFEVTYYNVTLKGFYQKVVNLRRREVETFKFEERGVND